MKQCRIAYGYCIKAAPKDGSPSSPRTARNLVQHHSNAAIISQCFSRSTHVRRTYPMHMKPNPADLEPRYNLVVGSGKR